MYYFSRWGTLEAGLPALNDPLEAKIHDGYGLRNLARHLRGAGRVSELHQLLRLEQYRKTGSSDEQLGENFWHAAHERRGDVKGYVKDVAEAWRAAEQVSDASLEQSEPSVAVGLELRYGLTTASIRSLTWNFPPALMAALLNCRLWTDEQALAYALLIPDKGEQVCALSSIAGHLSETLRKEAQQRALATAQGIQDVSQRARALAEVGRFCDDSDRPAIVKQAFADAQTAKTEIEFAGNLREIASELGEEQLQQSLQALLAGKDSVSKLIGFQSLIPYLSQQQLREAFASAPFGEESTPLAQALATVVRDGPDALKSDLIGETFDAIRSISADEARATVLIEFAPELSQDQLGNAIQLAGAIKDEAWREASVAILGAALAEPDFKRKLETAEQASKCSSTPSTGPLLVTGLENWIVRFQAPGNSFPRTIFPRQQAQDGLEIARALPEKQRARLLSALVLRLPEEDLDKAVEMAIGLQDANLRGSTLFSLAVRRPEPLRREVLAGIAGASIADRRPSGAGSPSKNFSWWGVANIEQDDKDITVITRGPPPSVSARLTAYIGRLLPYSNEEQLRDLLRGIRSMPQAQDRRGALRILAPALSKSLLAEASRMVQLIGDARERASSMVSLARRDLPEALVHKVIAECESFPDPADRAGMLVGMLRQVPEPLAQDIRAKAKSDAAQVEDPLIRASLRQSLDPEAIELEAEDALKQLCKTIEEGRSVATHPWAAEAWAAEPLGNYLADEHYGPVARLLNIFGPHMSVLQLQDALSQVRSIAYPRPRAKALAFLARFVPDALKEQAQAGALAAAWESEQADALLSEWYLGSVCTPATVISVLSPALSETRLAEAHAKAISMSSPFSRAVTLLELFWAWSQLPDSAVGKLESLNKCFIGAWKASWSIDRDWDWAPVAAALIPLASDSGLERILARMRNSQDGGSQAVIVTAFARSAPNARWPDLLEFVRTMQPHEVDKDFLQGLGTGPTKKRFRPEIVAMSGGSGAQAKALSGLAAYLPEPLLPKALSLALELDGDRRQEIALQGLMQRIAKLEPSKALPFFQQTLRVLATRHRDEFLKCLRAMLPVLSVLGGASGTGEAIQAIQDCGRWWP